MAFRFPFFALALGLLLASPVGWAEESEETEVETHVDALARNLAEQRREVEKEMMPGGRFVEISEADREAVLDGLDRMARIIGNSPTIDALGPDRRAELLTEQSAVNVLLTQAHRLSRVVCKRERVTGSRVKRNTRCLTVAAWDRQREIAQEEMRWRQRGMARENIR